MRRFVIIKSTSPCEYPWYIINANTGTSFGQYRTEILAEKTRRGFEGRPLANHCSATMHESKDTPEDASECVERPGGDTKPKRSRHSDKRPVELR